MAKETVIQARVSEREASAWRAGAKQHRMTMSQFVRSAVATFLVNGKRTIIVPAAPDLPYVEELRKDDEFDEPVRGTTGLMQRRAKGMSIAEAKEAEVDELEAVGRKAREALPISRETPPPASPEPTQPLGPPSSAPTVQPEGEEAALPPLPLGFKDPFADEE